MAALIAAMATPPTMSAGMTQPARASALLGIDRDRKSVV